MLFWPFRMQGFPAECWNAGRGRAAAAAPREQRSGGTAAQGKRPTLSSFCSSRPYIRLQQNSARPYSWLILLYRVLCMVLRRRFRRRLPLTTLRRRWTPRCGCGTPSGYRKPSRSGCRGSCKLHSHCRVLFLGLETKCHYVSALDVEALVCQALIGRQLVQWFW